MRYLVIFLLLWSAISDFFAGKLHVLGYVDEIVVLILLLDLILYAIANAHKPKKDLRFSISDLLIIVLFAWTFGSFLINRSSPSQLFLFLFSISKGFILFYWIKKFVKEPLIVKQIVTVLKWLIIVQIPFFIIGLIVFRSGYFGDNAVGAIITGDASSVGTYFWMGIMVCVALYEKENNRHYLWFALTLALLLIVTSTKQLTILLPLVLFYLYARKIKAANLKRIVFIGLGVLAGLMLYTSVERKWMLNYGVDTSEVGLLDYMDESEKLLGYYSLLYELPSEIKHPIMWGTGPGMYGSYVAMNARTPLSQKYIMYYYDLIPDGLGGTLAYRSSSIIGFWGDIGLVGLLLIIAIYVYQTFHKGRKMKLASQPILYNLIIACGLLLLAQSFILNIFEGNTFTLNLFWILCGLSVADIHEKGKEIRV